MAIKPATTAQPRSPEPPSTSNGLQLLQVAVIVVATFWIFSPAMNGDWLWDDNIDITDNAAIQAPAGLWKIWFEPGSLIDYYPIKASVQWLQWQLWHTHTFGYHLTNILLHITGAMLIWRLLDKLGLRLAWLGGLIFAIHPAQVESVAWIAELKNTLSLPPFLLSMCAWIDYENHGRQRDYFLALGFFLAAMLCKTTMMMFPVVILFYAWWKRDAIRWTDLKASAPFFLISLALGLMTLFIRTWYLHLHHTPSDVMPAVGGLLSRLALVGLSLSSYFSLFFWPIHLLPIYPQWTVDPPSLIQFLPWPILGGLIYFLWIKREGWGRHALLGLGFFLINLAPFLGFIPVSYMRFTWVMDHFLYIPIIGLIGLIVAGLERLRNHLSSPFRFAGIGIVTVIAALLAWESHGYAAQFINQETLWTYTIRHNPGAWLAHANLGIILRHTGRIPEAIEQYKQTLKINPGYAAIHCELGIVLFQQNQTSEAIDQFQQALKIDPNYAYAHNNLGSALALENHLPEAIEQYRQAIKIDPSYAEAHKNLGAVLEETGQISETIEQYQESLKIDPNQPGVRERLDAALQKAPPVKN